MKTSDRDTTAAIVDGVLKFVAAGGFITTAMLIPNAAIVLEKPANALFKKLDKRQQQRESRRIIHYMKSRGLITYIPRDYKHGVALTAAGQKRLSQRNFAKLAIAVPRRWDNKWRLVFFDIPETEKSKRNALNVKLKQLDFQQLQKSIWIHPFPCRTEIEMTCEIFGIRQYVTYVEIAHIDNEPALRERFKHLLNT